MCAVVAVAMMVASAAMAAYQSYRGAETANKQKEFAAAQQQANASASRQMAKQAEFDSRREANDKRKEAALRVGQMRARQGASGALADTGSFLDVTASMAEEGAKDAMKIVQQGDISSWKHRRQAGMDDWQAAFTLSTRRDPLAVAHESWLESSIEAGKKYASMRMGGG